MYLAKIRPMTMGDSSRAPAKRVGHAERDAAVERLRTALGDGQITLDELETRMEAALAARTAEDLDVLLADLPEPLGGASALLSSAAALPTVRLAASHGRVDRLGAWRVPPEVVLELRHSTGTLDLRHASLPPGGVRIVVESRHSSVKILVAEGAPVEMDEVGRHHSVTKDRNVRHVTAWSGPPIVITGNLHHSSLKILRPHRSWLARLLGRAAR
jgi:hypothetical protein